MSIPEIDPADCPTCGGFKAGYQEECSDCERQRRIVTERGRQAARDRKIGPLWPRE